MVAIKFPSSVQHIALLSYKTFFLLFFVVPERPEFCHKTERINVPKKLKTDAGSGLVWFGLAKLIFYSTLLSFGAFIGHSTPFHRRNCPL